MKVNCCTKSMKIDWARIKIWTTWQLISTPCGFFNWPLKIDFRFERGVHEISEWFRNFRLFGNSIIIIDFGWNNWVLNWFIQTSCSSSSTAINHVNRIFITVSYEQSKNWTCWQHFSIKCWSLFRMFCDFRIVSREHSFWRKKSNIDPSAAMFFNIKNIVQKSLFSIVRYMCNRETKMPLKESHRSWWKLKF